ncbi:hypothetical protein WN943_002485 [Citrus x changshan-huyou]
MESVDGKRKKSKEKSLWQEKQAVKKKAWIYYFKAEAKRLRLLGVEKVDKTHDSQDVRGRLAVQLIDSAFNEARAGLLAQANVTFAEHAAQARAIPSTLKANTYRIGAKAPGKSRKKNPKRLRS